MIYISKLFLLFVIFSFIGWCIEVVAVFPKEKKFVNRGFLIGPYCPIYGFGGILMALLLKDFMSNKVLLFVMASLICSALEYATSYFMEKIYKARWWDYSQRFANLNGRICLVNTVFFGVFGSLLMDYVLPFLMEKLDIIPVNYLYIIAGSFFAIMSADMTISVLTVAKLKLSKLGKNEDNTYQIKLKIREALVKDTYLTRRLLNAFPDINEIINKQREEMIERKQKLINLIKTKNLEQEAQRKIIYERLKQKYSKLPKFKILKNKMK